MNMFISPAPSAEFIKDLCRFIDEHGWSFTLARKALNYRYGTDYAVDELQRLYEHFRTATETIPTEK